MTIKTYVSPTSITVAVSQTITAGQTFTIFYGGAANTGSFAVSQRGNLYLAAYSSPNSTTTTVAHFGLRNTGGNCSLAFDYQTYLNGSNNTPNGRMTVTDDFYGASYRFWSRVQGSDVNALQTNFSIFANRAVTTAFITLDNGSGTMTVAQLIDSGLSATTLVASSATKQLQSVTLANLNGCNASFAGSTLTLSMTQDLAATATPTFANIIDTGLTATTLLSASGTKQLQSTAIAGAICRSAGAH